jgi:predicted RecB family endonuclease
MTTRPGLGDILVEERLIAREQLNQARRAAERLGSPLVTVLLEQGLVTEDDLVGALSRRLHMQLLDPGRTSGGHDAVRGGA